MLPCLGPLAPPSLPLFRSANLRVFARLGFPGRLVVVTFSSYADTPDLEAQGFGEAFLYRHAINAIHVVCGSNHWYQYPEIPAALAAIRTALSPLAEVVTYGSSMGGYAAINFSEDLGATRVVAIAPQYSIDSARMPRDRRWAATAVGTAFTFDQIALLRGRVDATHIVYDTRSPDRRHVARIRRTVRVVDVPIAYAGHPGTGFLLETRLLSRLVLSLLRGQHDPARYQDWLQAAQRNSAIYFVGLFKHVPRHRSMLRAALLDRAASLLANRMTRDPTDADAAYALFHVREWQARPTEAIEALRTYLRRSDYLIARLNLARLLLLHAPDASEGVRLLHDVLARSPKHPSARVLGAVALARMGHKDDALAILACLERQGRTRATRLLRRGLRDVNQVERWTGEDPTNLADTPRHWSWVDRIRDRLGLTRSIISSAQAALMSVPDDE